MYVSQLQGCELFGRKGSAEGVLEKNTHLSTCRRSCMVYLPAHLPSCVSPPPPPPQVFVLAAEELSKMTDMDELLVGR